MPRTEQLPRLRPGVHVVRRDAGHVQLGVDPPARVVLPDSPAVRRDLEALAMGLPVHDDALLRRLAGTGLLATADATPRPVVGVADHGLDPSTLCHHLERLGVEHRPAESGPHDLRVLTTTAPLSRELSDDLVATGMPHLLLCGTGTPGVLRLGPLVVPGVTACLRCVDAHESTADPRRGLVLAQLSELPGTEPAPVDLELALAWAARDLHVWCTGGEPGTWSASVDVGPGLVPTLRRWSRHPACGCAWDELAW